MPDSGNLSILLSSGIDAFSNLWDVDISFPTALAGSLQLTNAFGGNGVYSVRAIGFTPPELKVNTYVVDYKAVQLTRPNAKFDGNRAFDLEFRLDSKYLLYYDLMSWKHIFFDPSGDGNIAFGGLSGAGNSNYGIVRIKAYNSETSLLDVTETTSTNTAINWNFYDVICMGASPPSFQRQNSDSITTTASFIFGRLYEPGTKLTTDYDTPGTPSLGFSST